MRKRFASSAFEKLTWAFGSPAHAENQIEHSGISLRTKAYITAKIFRTATTFQAVKGVGQYTFRSEIEADKGSL